MDLVDCARLYALTSIASADAFIAVFDAKYALQSVASRDRHPQCRPTVNPATPREASWLPLGDDADASGISLRALHRRPPPLPRCCRRRRQRDRRDFADQPDGARRYRKWTRLQDYSDEVSHARIYAGFHYRFSTEVGKEMGKKIGDLAVTTLMPGAVDAQQKR